MRALIVLVFLPSLASAQSGTEWFAQGLARKANAREAQPCFARAAQAFDHDWQVGPRSPALAINRARAHTLAGDLPRAIVATRQGIAAYPTSVALRQTLETCHRTMSAPADLPPPALPTWRRRFASIDLILLSLAGSITLGFGLLLSGGRGWLASVVGVGILSGTAAAGMMVLLEQRAESARMPIVLTEETVLRSGNGPSYPAKREGSLPRGCEAYERGRRGGWVQIELTNGMVGWVPQAIVLSVREEATNPGSVG